MHVDNANKRNKPLLLSWIQVYHISLFSSFHYTFIKYFQFSVFIRLFCSTKWNDRPETTNLNIDWRNMHTYIFIVSWNLVYNKGHRFWRVPTYHVPYTYKHCITYSTKRKPARKKKKRKKKTEKNSIRHTTYEWNVLINFGSNVSVHLTCDESNLILSVCGSLLIIVRFKLLSSQRRLPIFCFSVSFCCEQAIFHVTIATNNNNNASLV